MPGVLMLLRGSLKAPLYYSIVLPLPGLSFISCIFEEKALSTITILILQML